MASASRIASARDQIATALALITTGNGYQNTVANVSKSVIDPKTLTEWPHICIELGQSRIIPKDDARTLYDEETDVHIVAYVQANSEPTLDPASAGTNLQNAMESMVWDLKQKILSGLITVNINDATNRWNIRFTNGTLTFDRIEFLGLRGQNFGMITCDFKVIIRNLDSSVDD